MEPLGVDIDHVVITALATGLETPVKVACLERTAGNAQIVEFFGDDAQKLKNSEISIKLVIFLSFSPVFDI